MKAVIYSREQCVFCDQAKFLLEQHGIPFDERVIGRGHTREELLELVPGARSVPQIFLGDQLIGGYNELKHHLRSHPVVNKSTP
jgi:glutaredoxin 3